MVEFLKKNIFIIILSSITLFLGFLTFLTFIDRSFIELNQNNLQYLLIVNILLLLSLFVFIFLEVKKSIRNDIDKDGLKSNKKYITYFSLFTLIPSILISIFSLFLFSFALEKYFDKKVTTVVNNSFKSLIEKSGLAASCIRILLGLYFFKYFKAIKDESDLSLPPFINLTEL